MRLLSLVALTLGTLLTVAAGVRSAWAPPDEPVAPVLLACGTALLLAGLFSIGSGSRVGRTLASLLAGAGLGALLVGLVALDAGRVAGEGGETLLLGLPPGAALTVYGLGLAPVLLMPLVFTLTERGTGLDPQSLHTLRRDANAASSAPADGTDS